jgi:hypothetical protein
MKAPSVCCPDKIMEFQITWKDSSQDSLVCGECFQMVSKDAFARTSIDVIVSLDHEEQNELYLKRNPNKVEELQEDGIRSALYKVLGYVSDEHVKAINIRLMEQGWFLVSSLEWSLLQGDHNTLKSIIQG